MGGGRGGGGRCEAQVNFRSDLYDATQRHRRTAEGGGCLGGAVSSPQRGVEGRSPRKV